MNVNGKINPDVNNLNKLNKIQSWIPSGNQIRRTHHMQNIFDKDMKSILSIYNSFKDYIYDKFFNQEIAFSDDKLKIINSNFNFKYRLCINDYPYNISNNTLHYVLWYNYYENNEKNINDHINLELKRLKFKDNTKFVWYENPKINDEIYHIHVFIKKIDK